MKYCKIFLSNAQCCVDTINLPEIFVAVSFDFGMNNFGIRVEERNIDGSYIVPFQYCLLSLENSQDMLLNIRKYIDENVNIFMSSTLIVLEKQMNVNKDMIRLYMFTFGYLMGILRSKEVYIVEVTPHLKKAIFKLPNGREGKKRGVEIVKQLFEDRKDVYSLDILNSTRTPNKVQGEDLSDPILQLEGLLQILKKHFLKKIKNI